MTYRYFGKCKECEAPTYVPEVWHGVFPPEPKCMRCDKPKQLGPKDLIGSINLTDDSKVKVRFVDPEKLGIYRDTAQQIAETRAILDKIKREQLHLEEQRIDRVVSEKDKETERAMLALEKSFSEQDDAEKAAPVIDEKLTDLEARMDRLETMMIKAAEHLSAIRERLDQNAIGLTPPPGFTGAESHEKIRERLDEIAKAKKS